MRFFYKEVTISAMGIIYQIIKLSKLKHDWDHEFSCSGSMERLREEDSKVIIQGLCRKNKLNSGAILGRKANAHSGY